MNLASKPNYTCSLSLLFLFFVFLFFVFLGPHPQQIEFLRPGVELEDAIATAIPDLSRICDLHHSLIPDP